MRNYSQDEEVDRLERASRAACASQSRQEVLESMYGRADPAPAGVVPALVTVSGSSCAAWQVHRRIDACALCCITLMPHFVGPLCTAASYTQEELAAVEARKQLEAQEVRLAPCSSPRCRGKTFECLLL